MDHPSAFPTLTSLKADIKSFKELIRKNHQPSTDTGPYIPTEKQFPIKNNQFNPEIKNLSLRNKKLSEENKKMKKSLTLLKQQKNSLRNQLRAQNEKISRIFSSESSKIIANKSLNGIDTSRNIKNTQKYQSHEDSWKKLLQSSTTMINDDKEIKKLQEQLNFLIGRSHKEENKAIKLQFRNKMAKLAGRIRYLKNQKQI